ncbi:MAG TPA: hypothetical protein VEI82_03920, partial [Myxococcota bacterium]|nr:hypothetical protein [Myxococcota bacterium]
MTPRLLRSAGIALLLALTAVLLPSDVTLWIDPAGRTWLTDRADRPSATAERVSPEELQIRWDHQFLGERLPRGTRSGDEDDRYLAEVRTAQADAQQGNLETALRALRRLEREHPARPEAPLL